MGVNALFHDLSAALVVDGRLVAAAEEERFSRQARQTPRALLGLGAPELSMRWCLEHAGLAAQDLDAVAYSFDPQLAKPAEDMGLDDPQTTWAALRRARAGVLIASALPGLDRSKVRFVAHHVAHAASAAAAPVAQPAGRPAFSCSTAEASRPPTCPDAMRTDAWTPWRLSSCRTLRRATSH